MRVLVTLFGLVCGQIEAPSDSPLPDVSGDVEVGEEPAEVKASEEPPLESRSTAEWRKGFMAWRRQAVSAVPARYPLREEDLALLDRVRDRNAVSAIAALYKQERDLRVRMAYLRALSHIETTPAIEMLVQVSLADKEVRLRRLAAEGIAKMRNRKEAVELLARAIRNGKNRERALEVLDNAELTAPVSPGELPDPALTTALIDSLWVPQIKWVERELRASWTSPAPGTTHGTCSNYYYGRFRVPVEVTVQAPPVLETLRRYSGEEYGYDQDAWRAWYNARQREFAEQVR